MIYKGRGLSGLGRKSDISTVNRKKIRKQKRKREKTKEKDTYGITPPFRKGGLARSEAAAP